MAKILNIFIVNSPFADDSSVEVVPCSVSCPPYATLQDSVGPVEENAVW